MKAIVAACALALIPGCADMFASTEHEEHHGPRHPGAGANILVLESDHIDRPAEVLGFVDVHEPVHNIDEALAELREHAAELGAEAILGVELHHGEGGPAPTHLSGTAIRFRDLIRGRKYDVLGNLEVTEPMGHEEEANRELGHRASALGADLIINVNFQHGEGEGPIKVTGTAIKFRPSFGG